MALAAEKRKFVLIILDGLGLRDAREANAFVLARTPVFDRLFTSCPWTAIEASGEAVGLPAGVIGNSEVGHKTIGAGRIIKNDLIRINDAVEDGSLGEKGEFAAVIDYVRQSGSTLHLMGLVSDAGVHSHIEHILELLSAVKEAGLDKVCLHAIMDGRDTSPRGGKDYLTVILDKMNEIKLGRVATVIGRYYAMDRDGRWERTEKAYRALVAAEGERTSDAIKAIEKSYDSDITDEFIEPIIITDDDEDVPRISQNDALFCFNFRADRMRQICRALGEEGFDEFTTAQRPVSLTTMTSYDSSFSFPVMFKPVEIRAPLGNLLQENGYRQLRVAETEKYAHVTYFFNCGEETPFPDEKRILVPSPKVATYDLMPEMSAYGIQETVLRAIDSDQFDCAVMNLANPDMVGHTGNLEAAIKATEVSDSVLGEVLDAVIDSGAMAIVTADHGNCETMVDEQTGSEHTAHTMNPVPFVLVNAGSTVGLQRGGSLADVAPTMLDLLNISAPDEMTGKSLVLKR